MHGLIRKNSREREEYGARRRERTERQREPRGRREWFGARPLGPRAPLCPRAQGLTEWHIHSFSGQTEPSSPDTWLRPLTANSYRIYRDLIGSVFVRSDDKTATGKLLGQLLSLRFHLLIISQLWLMTLVCEISEHVCYKFWKNPRSHLSYLYVYPDTQICLIYSETK